MRLTAVHSKQSFRSPALACLAAAALLVSGVASLAQEPRNGDAPGPAQQEQPLRFIAIGDTGKGNETQYAVARAMKTVCDEAGGCAFALLLGDNIYPAGITTPTDPQMEEKFERPYAELSFPFYAVLGNHDYGPSWEFWRAQAELDYAKRSPKFRMPSRHYAFTEGPAAFIAVDTKALFWEVIAYERRAFKTSLAKATAPWKIAFGHHPYLSNGKHGNAGNYEGLPFGWLPGAGGGLRDFFEDEVCGKVDLYLSGHDHSLQDLGERCGTEWIVSGAGASTTPLGERNPVRFQASVPGFVLLEATATQMLVRFFDDQAREVHRREITRKP